MDVGAPSMKAKRSLGTKPSTTMPKRMSNTQNDNRATGRMPLADSANGQQQGNRCATASTGGPSSSSRLPRPASVSTTKTSNKRSVSSSSATKGSRKMLAVPGRGGHSSNFVTPVRRSQSNTRTPQRIHQLQAGAVQMGRISVGGSSARGSTIGVKAMKDSRLELGSSEVLSAELITFVFRPLSDKAWQRKAVEEIVYFLDESGYPKKLVASDFMERSRVLNSTDFKGVFEFCMKIIKPTYEMPQRKLELELPATLKRMTYQGQLSKAQFQVSHG
jgi:hypothetical protein